MPDNKLNSALSELKAMEQAAHQATERFSRLKKAQKGTILVVALVLAWLCYHLFSSGWIAKEFHHQPESKDTQTMVIATRPISQELSLTGSLEPFKTVNIPAPFNGPVTEIAFSYGAEVKRGQKLMVLNDSDLLIKLRNAEADFIKAKQAFENTTHWSQSTESRDAQRELISSRSDADNKKRKYEEAKALYKDGIISRNDLDQARDDFSAANDSLASAKDKYKAELKKGDSENVHVAEIKLENAKAVFENYKAKEALATVTAPVRGVVMKPQTSGSGKPLEISEGTSVTAGQPMLAIADLESMEVQAKADEVDVVRLRVGQQAHVTGEAFPGVVLAGVIHSIASQATKATSSDHPYYRVDVTIKKIPAEVGRTVRIGMTTELQAVVYENPKAILIPISAVNPDTKTVQVVDPATGKSKTIKVTTGVTTLQDVEIIKGLSVGDKILIQ